MGSAPSQANRALEGRVALVAGATRGLGRAIARELARAGATVYATGRSTRARASEIGRPETIEETAELIEDAGGRATAVQVDHLDPAQVAGLVQRIDREQDGRLDIVVNDVWGGEHLVDGFPPRFWEADLADGLRMLDLGARTHLITAWHAAPLLVARGEGLVVEVTDGIEDRYRGSLFYDLAKATPLRAARGMAEDLRPHGVTVVAVTPGFLRSEQMLDHFGVTEENWRDAVAQERHFGQSETPHFLARGLAALAADPGRARDHGGALGSWDLARRYGIEDVDGRRPDWGRYAESLAADGEL